MKQEFFLLRLYLVMNNSDNRAFVRRVLTLAVPITIQAVISLSVNLIDNLMIGRLGDIVISACSLATSFYMLFQCTIMGIANGGIIVITQYWAQKNIAEIKKLIAFCLLASTACGLLLGLVGYAFPVQILSIYSDKTFLYEQGSMYLRIISLSFVMTGISSALIMILRAIDNVKFGLRLSIVSCLVNVFLNYIMIFGKFGFPVMGLKGAGIATVIARGIELVACLVYLFAKEKELRFRFGDLMDLSDKGQIISLLKVSLPIFISESYIMINSTFQTMISGHLSETYMTANSVIHNIWLLCNVFSQGISASAGVIIGHDIGEDPSLRTAYHNAERLTVMVIIVGILSGLLVLATGPFIISLYNISDEAHAICNELLLASAIVVFFMSCQSGITKGIVRAGGKTGTVLLIDIVSSLLVGIPLGYLCALVWKLNPFVIYVALRSNYIALTVWGLYKIRKQNWIIKLKQ